MHSEPPWMLRDGSYGRADSLRPGDSLMPLYRRLRQISPTSQEYEQVWHPGKNRWEYTHRVVSRSLGFGAGRGQVIHHWFDGLRQLNNDPRNLERLSKQAHIELHARLGGNLARARAATDPGLWGNRRRDVTFADVDQAARAVVTAGSKLTWQAVADKLECSQDVIYARVLAAGYASWQSYRLSLVPRSRRNRRVNDRSREKIAGTWQDQRFREVTFGQIDEAARELSDAGSLRTWRDVAGVVGCDQVVLYSRIQAEGYASWEEYRRSLVLGTGKGHNSGVSFAGVSKVCRAEVAAGRPVGAQAVCKMLGCGTGMLYRVLRAEGFEGWKDYKASLTHNHKVVAVCPVEPEAVYDIEVEDHHNFALSAGVFVHNSGFRQRTFFQGRTIDVKIPKETALYFSHDEAERPFYGVSMFESAFFHYDKKVKLYYITHIAAQRAACGLRVGTMKPNPNAADKNNFTQALANLGLAQYIVLPDADWTVTNLKEEGNFDFLGLINHHNSQMSKSMLAAWFDEAQGSGQGDSALVDFGNQDDATWLMMLDGILAEAKEVIDNEIFPRFIDWNFGSEKYPEFKWGELTAEQKAAIQDTFDKLAVAGQTANVTPEFMLELEQRMAEDLGLDIDYDKIKAEREKQQKLMQQQAKAQAAMMENGQPVMAGNSAGPQGGQPGQPGAPGAAAQAQSSGPQSSARTVGGPYGEYRLQENGRPGLRVRRATVASAGRQGDPCA